MTRNPSRHLALPLLALCLVLAGATTAQAQGYGNDRGSGGTATLQITFGTQPRWSGIPGTHVREIRGGGSLQYDMFRFGGLYYVFDNDRWYSSRSGHGQFVVIDERSVPREFTRIPRRHWKHYPAAWGNGAGNREHNGNDRGNSRGNGRDRR